MPRACESQASLQERHQSPQSERAADNTFIIYLSSCITEVFTFFILFLMCSMRVKDSRRNWQQRPVSSASNLISFANDFFFLLI